MQRASPAQRSDPTPLLPAHMELVSLPFWYTSTRTNIVPLFFVFNRAARASPHVPGSSVFQVSEHQLNIGHLSSPFKSLHSTHAPRVNAFNTQTPTPTFNPFPSLLVHSHREKGSVRQELVFLVTRNTTLQHECRIPLFLVPREYLSRSTHLVWCGVVNFVLVTKEMELQHVPHFFTLYHPPARKAPRGEY
jgi:hypothetical protein